MPQVKKSFRFKPHAGPHPKYGVNMETVQIRVTPKMLEMVDRNVMEGLYESRSALVRDCIRRFLEGK